MACPVQSAPAMTRLAPHLLALLCTLAAAPAAATPRGAAKARPAAVQRTLQPTTAHDAGGKTALGFGRALARQLFVPQTGRFQAGVPTMALTARAAPGTWGRQRMSQWCWAATSQMILNYIGLPVSQEAVITRAYGGFLDRPASPAEIAFTLNGWVVAAADNRRYVVVAQDHAGLVADQIVADLTAQRPLIVGLVNPSGVGGHAYVLTAVSYDVDAAGRPFIKSATLRDPWPSNPSAIELSWGEMNQRFIGAVRIDIAEAL
jgi:hypothetical protein